MNGDTEPGSSSLTVRLARWEIRVDGLVPAILSVRLLRQRPLLLTMLTVANVVLLLTVIRMMQARSRVVTCVTLQLARLRRHLDRSSMTPQ